MTWKTDPRTLKSFGSFTLISEVNQDRQTSHLVTFPDGRKARVLPTRKTGAYRAKHVAQVLYDLKATEKALGGDFGHLDVMAYFEGVMRNAGIDLETVE